MTIPENFSFIQIDIDNVEEHGVFCIKNKKASGYKAKIDWFKKKINNGLEIIIVKDNYTNKQLGFIEYLPSEIAWRPISAKNYLFIQCIAMFSKNERGKLLGSELVRKVIQKAKNENKNGVCVMSSNGPWMANKSLFEKNGFTITTTSDRFELLTLKLKGNAKNPSFFEWSTELEKFEGWNLVYSDQCPWHDKVVLELEEVAKLHGVELIIRKINSPEEAQMAPSGFATFSLINNGKLLADHYISKTRFKTILKNELAITT